MGVDITEFRVYNVTHNCMSNRCVGPYVELKIEKRNLLCTVRAINTINGISFKVA